MQPNEHLPQQFWLTNQDGTYYQFLATLEHHDPKTAVLVVESVKSEALGVPTLRRSAARSRATRGRIAASASFSWAYLDFKLSDASWRGSGLQSRFALAVSAFILMFVSP